MALDSPGDSVTGRGDLEAHYEEQVRGEVQAFLSVLLVAALAGTLTAVLVLSRWERTVEKVEKTSPLAAQYLRGSAIPQTALAAALGALATAQAMGLSKAEQEAAVATSLGLATDPVKGSDGKFGRILGPDGGYSWVGSSDAATRTAATADFGERVLQNLREEGYTHKRWMTRYDSRVRESHANVDRDTIPLDADFIVGGVALRYPGDPMSAEISEVVNCRCVLFGVNPGLRPWDFPEGSEPWNDPYPG